MGERDDTHKYISIHSLLQPLLAEEDLMWDHLGSKGRPSFKIQSNKTLKLRHTYARIHSTQAWLLTQCTASNIFHTDKTQLFEHTWTLTLSCSPPNVKKSTSFPSWYLMTSLRLVSVLLFLTSLSTAFFCALCLENNNCPQGLFAGPARDRLRNNSYVRCSPFHNLTINGN